MAAAVGRLKRAGATSVRIVVTHALFGAEVAKRLTEAGAVEVVSTESVPHPTNKIELAGVLAEAVRAELEGTGDAR